ncbi:hypothetical protein [Pedobacter sp. MC2016-24]|uniref:hypothetical protein n=1 Tax=Pedobacter sp. MC2016-24 TaxID=2780090 RepID=UPI00187EC499|nr:hypothetical protein [Pedobacter sp. MC2016-24]MBE9597845.1 hypothetical protein [Pedobacter sp. MC2016-24]
MDIIMPSGKTQNETDALAKANQKNLYTQTFAKGHCIIYFDRRCREGHAIRANSYSSEELIKHDGAYNDILVSRLAEEGKGKYAYLSPCPKSIFSGLINDQRYIFFKFDHLFLVHSGNDKVDKIILLIDL